MKRKNDFCRVTLFLIYHYNIDLIRGLNVKKAYEV